MDIGRGLQEAYEQGRKDAVRHGKWVITDDGLMECSKCRWLFSYIPALEEEWYYCPTCWAKMDKE